MEVFYVDTKTGEIVLKKDSHIQSMIDASVDRKAEQLSGTIGNNFDAAKKYVDDVTATILKRVGVLKAPGEEASKLSDVTADISKMQDNLCCIFSGKEFNERVQCLPPGDWDLEGQNMDDKIQSITCSNNVHAQLWESDKWDGRTCYVEPGAKRNNNWLDTCAAGGARIRRNMESIRIRYKDDLFPDEKGEAENTEESDIPPPDIPSTAMG